MILEAKYIGPFSRVSVPGFEFKSVKRGELTKLRVPDGNDIGGCWEIIRGREEYEAARAKAEDSRKANLDAKQRKREETKAAIERAREARMNRAISQLTAGGEIDATATKTKTKPASKDGE